MKIQKLAIVLFASIAIPATSLADSAVDYCANSIMDVQIELYYFACADGLGWGEKGKSICYRLDSKLVGAISKIESYKLVNKKVQDALDKLSSFQATIDHLAEKGIIEDTPAGYSELSRLTALNSTAASCVSGLFKYG